MRVGVLSGVFWAKTGKASRPISAPAKENFVHIGGASLRCSTIPSTKQLRMRPRHSHIVVTERCPLLRQLVADRAFDLQGSLDRGAGHHPVVMGGQAGELRGCGLQGIDKAP